MTNGEESLVSTDGTPIVLALVGGYGTSDVLDRQQQNCQNAQHVELGELLGPPEVGRVPLEDLLDHDQKTRNGEKAGCEGGRKSRPFPSSDPKGGHAANCECAKGPAREINQGEQTRADGGQHR